jgi:hypothetical protein
MLAVYCACCSRPLVDSVSVETGVGPECRKKHGYAEAQQEPDWAAVLRETDGLVAVAEIGDLRVQETLWRLGGLETRKVANLLVHRIACAQAGPEVGQLTNALRALGFVKLAARIAKRLATVQVEVEDGAIFVKAPYSEEAVAILRAVPGRRWMKTEKLNSYPISSRAELFQALKRAYPGKTGFGPKGLFQL